MSKFPVDAPKARVLRSILSIGFRVVREGNHSRIKGSTLRTACARAGLSREEFLRAYEQQ